MMQNPHSPYIINQQPGDYNYSHNQNYLMSKMNNIDIYWSWFWLIALGLIFVIAIIFFLWIWRKINISRDEYNRAELILSKGLSGKQKEVFSTLLQLIKSYEELSDCMPISDDQAHELYFKDMIIMFDYLSVVDKYIYQYANKYDVRKYDYYKKKLLNAC